MTTVSPSVDTAHTWTQALRAAVVILVALALLAGVFIVGRVSAPSATASPSQTHLQVPAASAGAAPCNLSTRLVTAC